MPLPTFIKKWSADKEQVGIESADQPDKIVKRIVIITEEVDADPYIYSVENRIEPDGSIFFGIFFFICLNSFFFADLMFDIDLFQHWIIWLSTSAILSFVILINARMKNIVWGYFVFQLVAVAFMLINDLLDHPVATKNTSLIIMSGGGFVWGYLCFQFEKIWRVTNALTIPLMIGFFIALAIVVYNA